MSQGDSAFSLTLLMLPLSFRSFLSSHSEHLLGWKRSLNSFSGLFGLAHLQNRYIHLDLNVSSILGLHPICSTISTILRPFLYSRTDLALCWLGFTHEHLCLVLHHSPSPCFLPWNSTGIICSPAPGCYKHFSALGALLLIDEADTLLKRISAALFHYFYSS